MNPATGSAASAAPADSGRFWASLLIALAGAAVYARSFSGPFVFDDVGSILENATIRRWSQLGTVLSPPAGGLTVSPSNRFVIGTVRWLAKGHIHCRGEKGTIGHQRCGAEGAGLLEFDNGAVDARRETKVVRVDDQASHFRKCTKRPTLNSVHRRCEPGQTEVGNYSHGLRG